MFVGVPVPDPVETPLSRHDLAALAGNQVRQQVEIRPLVYSETRFEERSHMSRRQPFGIDAAPGHIARVSGNGFGDELLPNHRPNSVCADDQVGA